MAAVAKARVVFACSACAQQLAQWAGRCPGCGEWGTVEEVRATRRTSGAGAAPWRSRPRGPPEERVATGLPDLDRVLGGGLVPSSVVLLAGAPGIGKSTLLLHLLGSLAGAGRPCLLVSGEESRAQVPPARRRLGVPDDALTFAPGRELPAVIDAARATDRSSWRWTRSRRCATPRVRRCRAGVSQVRICTDALSGLAKEEGSRW